MYKHYGRQIIAQMMGKPEGDPAVEAVYLRVYKNFMEAIDGIDNGANPCIWASASHASKPDQTWCSPDSDIQIQST